MITTSTAAVAGTLLFIASMAWAGVSDLATMKIGNRLVGFLIIAYALLAPFAGLVPADMARDAAVAVMVLGVAFAMFAFGWIGGGDAKLAAATVLWLGAGNAGAYLVWTALFGGLLTLGLLLFRRIELPGSFGERAWIARLHHARTGVPYGLAMATAAIAVFPATAWVAPVL